MGRYALQLHLGRSVSHLTGDGLHILGSKLSSFIARYKFAKAGVHLIVGVLHQLYLSLQVCKELIIVPHDFSSIQLTEGAVDSTREPPPIHPYMWPCNLTQENVNSLERWLL